MPNNDTFQACDFSTATQLTDGGTLPSGASFIDYVFEENSLNNAFYFASQNGCEDGQKIAVKVVGLYATSYDEGKIAGANSYRIQHCDCDHAVYAHSNNEAAHAGFVDGCKSEMPEDLSCCPGTDVSASRAGYNVKYTQGGNCMRKSDQPGMLATVRELYKFCSIVENKATCDRYKSGDCPYWRVYKTGVYAYNSLMDGVEGCDCTPDADGNQPAYCTPDAVSHGPTAIQNPGATGYMGMASYYQCSDCYQDPGCLDTNPDSATTGGHGRNEAGEECKPGFLRYNGLNNRMPDIPENHGCDGADSAFDVKCDWWYVWSNCKDLEDGKTLTDIDEVKRPHWASEITADECDHGKGAQWVAAMKMYLASPEYDVDFPATSAPTPAPTTAAPTPLPTAAPTTATTTTDVSEESTCRLEAMAALTVWLISVLQ
jgi:hypothetical protein